jgi:hypothetical protein
MERTTRRQLDTLAETFNAAMAKRGSEARVVVEQRYDYHALDLTTVDYIANHPGAAVKTLRLGTKSELAVFLRAMLEGVWLVDDYQPQPEPEPAPAAA